MRLDAGPATSFQPVLYCTASHCTSGSHLAQEEEEEARQGAGPGGEDHHSQQLHGVVREWDGSTSEPPSGVE